MNAMTGFKAETRITLDDPQGLLARLREHMGEHGVVSGNEGCWRVMLELGIAEARLEPDGLAFTVEAEDATSLSFLQWSVAEHLQEFTAGECPAIRWFGGIAAGSPLPYFREMVVHATRQISPKMRRITLRGKDLARFAVGGHHIRLLFSPRPGVTPVWPVMGSDGRQAWPEGERPLLRVYTIRRIDVEAGLIDVDFVLHEGDEMPGAGFAASARPGDIVGMMGPGGGGLPAGDRFILAGDETAIPAISRMLEEMPENASGTVYLEIANDRERQQLVSRGNFRIHWLSRNDRQAGTTDLLENSVRGECILTGLRDGSFLWVGCEHKAASALREFAKTTLKLPRERHQITAYWRRGKEGG
ncbi:Siderophore-interacting protein [Nitratireductor basaltis]|uniref:Siderophore-interacting protein n=2 Tax=Nitratireductor basaltis TaxID=472175 RepID=A0A084U5N8_9HYPH|nr:Siderophore-interacting protein [Nitratireductor basaltis]